MDEQLYEKKCKIDAKILSSEDAAIHLKNLGHDWCTNEQGHLYKIFKCTDFFDAFAIASAAAVIAEEEQHHPEINVKWGSCSVTLWTHSVDGLTENDFIVAAELERVLPEW